MGDKKKPDFFERVWKFFASVKFAVVILILLALTSIIGTIIEQRADQVAHIKFLTGVFGEAAAPTVYNIFAKLGFMDMYNSWWYVALLVLFCLNLIVCSLERFPVTLRLVKNPIRPLGESVIKTLQINRELKLKTTLKIAKDEIFNALTSSRFRVLEATDEDGVQLYSQKGVYTRFGVYFVHLSILLIFIGAIIGFQFGFGGFLNLAEGKTSNVIYASGGKEIPLGFSIKCNWYETEYYGNTEMPKEFHSELVIIEDGVEVLKKIVEVNHPLTYKGVTFYQSSYGMLPGAVGQFILKVTSENGQDKTVRLRPGQTFEIEGTDIKGTVVDFSPALAKDRRTGELFTYSENMVNPAVSIEFDGPAMEKFTGWVLKRYPETGKIPGGHKIEFIDYWGVEYTGLQVSKDPGVGVIYFACLIMTIGLYVAFFMSHKKVWIRLVSEKNSVRITVGGSAGKNRLAFEKDIDKILSKASKAIEGRSKK